MAQEDHDRFALPGGYRLKEYCIRQVLGQGGFGITYLAHDERLDRNVAVKEFMPSDLAVRDAGSTVIPRSMTTGLDYKKGLERFLKEARTLAQFSHPNIVRVLTLLEANGTAYIVMSYEAGNSLSDHLKSLGGPLPAAELLAIAEPLLDGLAAVHEAGFLHRDIKPSNIFLRANGTPVLLDFGTARQVVSNISRSLVSILTPGYAPYEQYHTQGDQRAWTDIYGMGAVLYSCISGRVPPDAPARVQAQMDKQPDPMTPAKIVGQGRYPEPLLNAIDRCLAVRPQDRLQSVVELRLALTAAHPKVLGSRPPQLPGLFQMARFWPALTAGGGAVLLTAAILIVLFKEQINPPVPPLLREQVNLPPTSPSNGQINPPTPSLPKEQLIPPVAALPKKPVQPPAPPLPREQVNPPTPSPPREQLHPPIVSPLPIPVAPTGPSAVEAEAELSSAREAIQVSTVYGRQTYRRFRQQEALPSLERLAKLNTRYQKQLDDVVQGIGKLDGEITSILQQYTSLVDTLAKHPDRFKQITGELWALDLPEAGKLARQHLIEHVEERVHGAINTTEMQASLDRSYSSRDLW